MWRLKDDDTRPVITAREQVRSAHAKRTQPSPDGHCVFYGRRM